MNVLPKILVIRSDKRELKNVEKFLSDVFKENNLPQKIYNKTMLCVSEAVINSIEHGNRNDDSKFVTIEVNCIKNEIDILIRDEGEGFDINEVKNPITSDNIMNESGRGIYIIKSLTNSLVYNDKGNSVQLKIECK